jgi:hypothetical protein
MDRTWAGGKGGCCWLGGSACAGRRGRAVGAAARACRCHGAAAGLLPPRAGLPRRALGPGGHSSRLPARRAHLGILLQRLLLHQRLEEHAGQHRCRQVAGGAEQQAGARQGQPVLVVHQEPEDVLVVERRSLLGREVDGIVDAAGGARGGVSAGVPKHRHGTSSRSGTHPGMGHPSSSSSFASSREVSTAAFGRTWRGGSWRHRRAARAGLQLLVVVRAVERPALRSGRWWPVLSADMDPAIVSTSRRVACFDACAG